MSNPKNSSESATPRDSGVVPEAELKADAQAKCEPSDAASNPASEATSDEDISELEQAKRALADQTDKYLRLNAEFQNYRKRVEKEKNDIFKYGNEKLLSEMLPIMDSFERAMESVQDKCADDKVMEGIGMIKKSLDTFFERNDVHKIEALGSPFDPEKHHAVLSEALDDVESNQVVDVLQEGYTLSGRVIRPSMVKVSS